MPKIRQEQIRQENLIFKELLSKLLKDQDVETYMREFRVKIGKMTV